MIEKRKELLALIENYFPIAEEELFYKQRILDFVRNNSNCFERSLEQGHITASSWLVNKSGEKFLLLYHAKLDQWFQLGGHADGCSDVLSVAIKEAQEESGINDIVAISKDIFDVDVHEIPASSKERAHLHYDIRFLLQVKSDEDIKINQEAKDLKWFDKNKADLPTQEKSIIRMFDKWVELSNILGSV